MARIDVKALSLNHAYRGRRFSTNELMLFKRQFISELKPIFDFPYGRHLKISYIFGVSSKASDVDNLVKTTQDCLATAYGFNDKMIYRIEVEKVDVKKGEEYIEFLISKL